MEKQRAKEQLQKLAEKYRRVLQHGKTNPILATIAKLAGALGVSSNELLK
jgi:hypothetical protein